MAAGTGIDKYDTTYEDLIELATLGGQISIEEFLEFANSLSSGEIFSEYFGTDLIGQPILTLNVIGSLSKKAIIVADKEIQVDPIEVNLGSLQFTYPTSFDNRMNPSTDFLNVDLKFKAISSNNINFDLVYYSTFDDGYDICDKIFAVWFGVVEGGFSSVDVGFVLSPIPLFKAVIDLCRNVHTKSKDPEYKISLPDLVADFVLQGITDRKVLKQALKQFKKI